MLDLDESIIDWSNRFPIDHWWREKHGVPFGSPEHLNASHLNMLFEFREQVMILEFKKKREAKELELDEDFSDLGLTKKDPTKETQAMTKKDIDREFEDLDLSQFHPSSGKKDDSETNLL